MCRGSEEGSYSRLTDFFVLLTSKFEGNEEEAEVPERWRKGEREKKRKRERERDRERERVRETERETEKEAKWGTFSPSTAFSSDAKRLGTCRRVF